MAEQPVRLAELLPGAPDVVVRGVSLDSRRVRPGDLYAALPGAATHGARFAADAVVRGAVAVLTDATGAGLADRLAVPVIVLDDPRTGLAEVAAALHGHPAAGMRLFGITGTNGKTSTLFLLEAALGALGETVGSLGTIGFRLAGRPIDRARTTITTPEAPDLQDLLGTLRDAGATSVAMEVSSHALALRRVAGLTFDAAAFTGLGRDHLEFHGTQEAYFAAKALLFRDGRSRVAVVDIDGEWGRRLVRIVRDEGGAPLTTGRAAAADFRLVRIERDDEQRSLVSAATPVGPLRFTVGMPGDFNAANAVTAAALVHAAGLDVTRAVAGFAEAAVPGRMQRVALPSGAPRVVVDFAHTPEAVAAALAALPAPRIVVLGAGGDRDPSKREPMGAAAAANAELVVVTDDNPRSEAPAAIRAAVLAGARGAASGVEVLDAGDRRSAIAVALARATSDTWVAVLGKGHESAQEIAGVVRPFDDAAVVRQEWRRISGGGPADA